jgi:hypothetical protein
MRKTPKHQWLGVMTAAQRAVVTHQNILSVGDTIWYLPTSQYQLWNGAAWVPIGPGAGGNSDTIRFEGNGVFPIDTRVDGAWIAPAACTVTRVAADIGERGGNGGGIINNIWDLNRNGVTMYTTQANRPAIAAAGGGGEASVVAALPDIVAIAQNDRITVDTDSAANDPVLLPSDFSIIIRVVY